MSTLGRAPRFSSHEVEAPQAWQKLASLSFGYEQAEHLRAGFNGQSIYKDRKGTAYPGQIQRKAHGRGLAVKTGEELEGNCNTEGSPFHPRRRESIAKAPTNSDTDINEGQ